MRYDDAELMRQLGAEYAIGTLQGAARRRFERLMETDPEARAQAAFWELRLSEFGQVVDPVAPPPGLRMQLLRQTGAPPAPSLQPSRKPLYRRRRAHWAWPYTAGFASAAALVLAFLVGQHNHVAPTRPAAMVPHVVASALPASPVMAGALTAEASLPIYVAQVSLPASSMGWLLSVSPDRRQLQVTASDDFLQAGRSRVQLWCVLPGAEPIALGALPVERDATALFDVPKGLAGASEVSFAITLEPEGSQAPARPSRPVLSSARAADAI